MDHDVQTDGNAVQEIVVSNSGTLSPEEEQLSEQDLLVANSAEQDLLVANSAEQDLLAANSAEQDLLAANSAEQDLLLANSAEEVSEVVIDGTNRDEVISIPSQTSDNSDSVSQQSPIPDTIDSEESNSLSCVAQESLSKKRPREESEYDEDGQICPICLDNWTNSGDHRICSLKCGHLFGYCCVTRWLQSQAKKSCPTCKKKVMKNDIRFIYAKKLIAVDTSEVDDIRDKLEYVIQERNKIQLELSKYICREHSLNQEIMSLKSQISQFKTSPALLSASKSSMTPVSSNSNVKLYIDKSLDICQLGGCRVFDTNPSLDMIMVNVKSPNSLFCSFGLRKICISQYKPLAFLPLHSGQIRDISFGNMRILSVSMDKSFRVTDAVSHSSICSSSLTMPLWSCCWDSSNDNYFYVGTQSGSVVKYDIRNFTTPLTMLSIPGDMSPVVSVAHILNGPGFLPRDGVISCKLNSLWFFENTLPLYTPHPLAIDGPFYAMKFDHISKQLLVSSRPNHRSNNSRHTLANLRVEDDKVNINTVHLFESPGLQRQLSRSCFIRGENEYVAAHEESSKVITLWNINSGLKTTSVPVHEPVLDLNSISINTNKTLVGLTEKKMLFYKFI